MLATMLALTLSAHLSGRPPAMNTLCPVCLGDVDEKNEIVHVLGQDYLICCTPCEEPLKRQSEDYLNPDGSLKRVSTKREGPNLTLKTHLD